MPREDDFVQGPIEGVRLPLQVWDVLQKENIGTMGQLRAASHRIEQIPGIDPQMGQAIRDEIARVASLEEKLLCGSSFPSPWIA